MKRLGEILLDWGVIAVSELHTALEACRRSGGRLGTQLLKFGFVDERSLLDALSEQYGVSSATARVLSRAPQELRSLLPPRVARRLQAVPFGRSGTALKVAMTNPGDPAKVEEISEITDSVIEPHVATERAILASIAELGEDASEVEARPIPSSGVRKRSQGEWERLWSVPRFEPHRLLGITPWRSTAISSTLVATFPSLSPVGVGEEIEPDQEIDGATFKERMAYARHRDEIGSLLLRFAVNYLARVCLFAVHRGVVVGWMAKGHGVVVDDVQSFSVPLDRPSLFHELFSGPDRHIGPIPIGGDNDALIRLMGEPKPNAVLMLPIRVKDHTVAFLIGDNPGEETVAVPADELATAAYKAGAAFETMILRKKILS
jgi:hypothetical protein